MRRGLVLLGLAAVVALAIWTLRTDDPLARRSSGLSTTSSIPSTPSGALDESPADPQRRTATRGTIVTKETGTPIEGARIQVDHSAVVYSDADGRFEIPAANRSGQSYLRIEARSHDSLAVNCVLGSEPLLFQLARGLSVSGKVINESGQPIPRLPVSAEFHHGRTDDSGEFSIGGIAPGPVEVSCSAGEGAVTVEAGARDVVVVAEGSHLLVHARDQNGMPLRGVRYTYSRSGVGIEVGGEAWSDFALFRLHQPGRDLTIRLEKEGYLPAQVKHAPRSRAPGFFERVAELRKRPPYSIRLHVHHFDATPAKAAHARLYGPDNFLLVQEQIALTDGVGVLRRVPSGSFRLQVHGDADYALGVVRSVDIAPNDDNRVRIDLQPGAHLRVTWSQYASRYRLEVRCLDDPTRRYFGVGGRTTRIWNLGTRIPLGRYRVAEMRGRVVMRKTTFDLRTTDPFPLDWSEEEED